MEVQVLLFASYAEAFRASRLKVSVQDGATASELLAKVKEMAVGHSLPPAPMIAVNQEYADADRVIRATDEVALIPPVAGG